MSKSLVFAIILAAACGGVYYYIHTNHIDLKSFFSGCECCHGDSGCSIDNKPNSVIQTKSNITTQPTVMENSNPTALATTQTNPKPQAEEMTNKNTLAIKTANPTKPLELQPLNKQLNTKAIN
jgi:hypothetical protein